MNKVWLIAVREFVATVFTKAFIIGLLIFPTILGIMAVVGPRLFGDMDFSVKGQLAVIDPAGVVLPQLKAALAEGRSEPNVSELVERARAGGAEDAAASVLQSLTDLTLVERPPDADVEREKAWLNVEEPGAPHLALVVVHADAVEPRLGESKLGSYDLYIPSGQDNRVEIAVQGALREAIIGARMGAAGWIATRFQVS
jgi:ABC-type Na+ efflux pump permease subunit